MRKPLIFKVYTEKIPDFWLHERVVVPGIRTQPLVPESILAAGH